ncbi:hypothetical protein [Halorussus lipolyticus]|uniref:hypothetical protein n=1 Tax=Halorussus lipolyticus TaxID=3034024 RepID=UPI0023E87713|nr:hypothetical protein [Halorussus sp. DT80]
MAVQPKDVTVAFSILQVVGLLLPILFIALQPYYEPFAKEAVQNTRVSIGRSSERDTMDTETEEWVSDNAPRIIKGGPLNCRIVWILSPSSGNPTSPLGWEFSVSSTIYSEPNPRDSRTLYFILSNKKRVHRFN